MESTLIPNAVRIFPFRLRKEGEDFCDRQNHYHFAEVVLAQKSDDAINAGQLCPLGGKRDDNETAYAALVRETQEETSCETVNLFDLRPVIQHYSFFHPRRKKTVQRTVLFAAGEIHSDHEVLRPRDQEEDKLFIRSIGYDQFLHLLAGEKLRVAGRRCSILDSLDPDEENRLRHGTHSSEREVLAVQRFLLRSLAIFEARVKKQILRVLMEKLWSHWEATKHCRHFSEEHDRLMKLKTEKPHEMEAFFDSFVYQHRVPLSDLILSYSEWKKVLTK